MSWSSRDHLHIFCLVYQKVCWNAEQLSSKRTQRPSVQTADLICPLCFKSRSKCLFSILSLCCSCCSWFCGRGTKVADRTRITEERDTGSSHSGCYREVDTHTETQIDTQTHIHTAINDKDSCSHWSLCYCPHSWLRKQMYSVNQTKTNRYCTVCMIWFLIHSSSLHQW